MKLHEYQSKRLFAQYGVPVPLGAVASTPSEAAEIAHRLGGTVVIKAQVLVGGRGKAGGIRLAKSPDEARAIAGEILGMEIKGLRVKKVLVDPAADIRHEIYLGMVLDRSRRRIVVMASSEGGVDIEEVAARAPEKILQVCVEPCIGLKEYQARDLAIGMGLGREQFAPFARICQGLFNTFVGCDASLAEINPLVVQADESMLAVDGKIVIDDNALFRHPELVGIRDEDEETPEEEQARNAGLSYVKLDGEIGCMVNGAGLAMATMDITRLFGGAPANFLDIGGGAKADRVTIALGIILSDPNVKAVLINIFGGITRCDEVARGILQALQEVPTVVPMIIRLVGTNEHEGREILRQAKMTTAETLIDAAQLAVEAAKSHRGGRT